MAKSVKTFTLTRLQLQKCAVWSLVILLSSIFAETVGDYQVEMINEKDAFQDSPVQTFRSQMAQEVGFMPSISGAATNPNER